MKRGVLALCASGLAQAAIAAPPVLSDAALDAVTAVIVADGATYELHSQQSVRVEGEAQENLRTLNVVGAAGSDVGNAVNTLVGASDTSGSVRQLNQLQQSESSSASLGRASLNGVMSTRRTATERHSASSSSGSQVTIQRMQSRSRSRTVDQVAAFVPSYQPLQDLTLEVGTPQLAPLHIAELSVDFLNDDGLFGIEGSIGPFTIGAPQFVLGTVSLEGDDVVLSSGHVVLPSVDLGNATVRVCFAACAQDSIDLGSFEGRTVDLPDGDLRFEGANPFKDTSFNAGSGIAMVGSGTVNVAPSHITLAGELTLDLPDPTFSFDFTIPSLFDDPDLIGPFEVDGPDITIEIPAVTVHHTFVDEDIGGGFSGTFDGFLCIVEAAMDCGTGARRSERRESRMDWQFVASSSSSHATGSTSTTVDEAIHAGASMTDAEAALIAMSQGSAQISAENTVTLTDSAQRGLRAANAVNAADTIVGNALNVMTRSSAALGQSNVFMQNRTSYGQ